MVSKTERNTSKDSEKPGAVDDIHAMENNEINVIDAAVASKPFDLGDTPLEVSEEPGAVDQFHVTDKICEVFTMLNDLNQKIVSWCISVWLILSFADQFVDDKDYFKEIYEVNTEVFYMSSILLVPWALNHFINLVAPSQEMSWKRKLMYFIYFVLSKYVLFLAFVFVCGIIWRFTMDMLDAIDYEPQGGKNDNLPRRKRDKSLDGIEEYEMNQVREQMQEMNADIGTANSEKASRKSLWVQRKDPRDSERFVKYLADKQKKLLETKRNKGRKKEVKPEGAASADDEKFKEKVLHQMKSISAAVPSDDYEMYVNLAMQGVAMLSLISTCTNSDEISKSIQGYLAGKLNVNVIKFLEKRLLRDREIVPEGDDDFTSMVARLRASTLDLMDAPFGKFLRDVLCVVIVQGMAPKNLFEEESVLFRFLDKMEKETLSISTRSYFETMFSIMEYSAGLVDAIRRGEDWMEYICPTSLSLRTAQILSQGKQLESGLLEDVSEKAMNELELETVSVQAQLKQLLLQTKGKLHVTHELQYQKVTFLLEQITAYRKNEGFRKSAFMFCLTGTSQIGKTELLDILIRSCEMGCGEEFTPDKIATIPVDAEYDDTIKRGTRVYKIDDAEALRPERDHGSNSVIKKILKLVNNVAMPTNQSAVERKANIFYRPAVVAMNTNVPHLNVNYFFHEPSAAYNRIVFIEVFLKKEFADENGKLNKNLANERGPLFSVPMHEFHPFNWVKTGSGNECARQYIGEKPMEAKEFFKWFSDCVVQHNMEQDALETKKLREREYPFCLECRCPVAPGWCDCKEPNIQPEGVVAEFMGTLLDDYALDMLSFTVTRVWETVGGRFALWFQNYALYIALQAIKIFVGANLLVDQKVKRFIFAIMASFCAFAPWWYSWSWLTTLFYTTLSIFFVYNAILGYAKAVRYNIVRLTLSSIHQQVAPTFLVRGTLALSVIAMLRLTFQMMEKKTRVEPAPYTGAYGTPNRVYQIVREAPAQNPPQATEPSVVIQDQGNLMPSTMDDIEKRAKERSDWDARNYIPFEGKHELRTITPLQLVESSKKNFWKMHIEGEIPSAMAFFVCSRVALFPAHSWNARADKSPSVKVKFSKDNDTFSTFVERVYSHETPHDKVMLQLSSGPSMRNLLKYFSNEEYSGMAYLLRRKRGSLEPFLSEVRVQPGAIRSSSGVLPKRGLLFQIRSPVVPTEKGECMSPLISIDGFPKIVGFHCGGDSNGNGAASFARKEAIEQMEVDFECQSEEIDWPLVFDDIDLNKAPYGETMIELDDVPDRRHVMFHYEDPSSYGCTLKGTAAMMRSKGFSDLRYTPMKEVLAEEGYQTIHCLPKPRADRDHAEIFSKKMDCMRDIHPDLLMKAIDDYTVDLELELERLKYGKREPLGLDTCLNGDENSKFINDIKEETSCGFGIKGKKDKLVDITYRLEDGKKVYHAKPELETEFNRLDELARNGKRINSLAVTALKIEPREAGPDGNPKKATRAFMVLPFASILLQKKYFGPIAAFIMSVPLLSECAAGINHTTDEWEQLYNFLVAFGVDRIGAGDYSGWDIRLSAQLIRAGSVVLMRLGAKMGYTKQDITAMRVLIDDIASMLVSYNGCVVVMDGWMKSGAWVTLILNSICNSLVHRCAWYAPAIEGTFKLSPHAKPFREVVHLATCGDDSVNGSKTDEFSMITMARFCDSVNLKYTDANKERISKAYEHINNVNFCKRQFRYEPELGRYLSPLNIHSIMRPFCFWTPGNQSIESYLIATTVAQLRELARHDRATFEKMHSVIFRACRRVNVDTLIPELFWTHSNWIGDLRTRYFTEDLLSFDPPLKISWSE